MRAENHRAAQNNIEEMTSLRLNELSAREYTHLTGNRKAAVSLGLPAFEHERNSIGLSSIGIVHDMKMKMRFGRIAGVPHFSQNIAGLDLAARLDRDRKWLQMCVVAELAIAVVDDDNISTWSRQI